MEPLFDAIVKHIPPPRAHALIENAGLAVPRPLFRGTAERVEDLWPLTRRSRFGGPSEGLVVMQPGTLALIRQGDAKKGDVLGTARLAGIMATRQGRIEGDLAASEPGRLVEEANRMLEHQAAELTRS